MNRLFAILAVLLFTAMVALGCSGGGNKNPFSPDTQNPQDVTGQISADDNSTTYLWGYYDVLIDFDSQTVEAVPNRDVMYTVNVVTFLNNQPPTLGFKFNSFTPGTGFIDADLDVSITHPIPGQPKFNGYDVRAVLITDQAGTLAYNSKIKYPAYGQTQFMTNADGYTRWWNKAEFLNPGLFGYVKGIYATNLTGSSTINPYKYFSNNLSATGNLWDFLTGSPNNGVFQSGSTNTRNFKIRFPTPTPGVKYGYAITANWESGMIHPSNAKEAVGFKIDDMSTLYYVGPSNNGGSIVLDISLYAWNNAAPTKIVVESNVLSSPHTLTPSEMTPTASGTNWATRHVEIPATSVPGLTGNWAWIIAEYGPNNYSNPFGVPNSASSDVLASYYRFSDLMVSNTPPCPTPTVISINPNTGDADTVIDNAIITVNAIEDGLSLGAKLTRIGQPDIIGTDVTFINGTSLRADFNLTGAADGAWNVEVMNGCGGNWGSLLNGFTVVGCPSPGLFGMDPSFGAPGDSLDAVSISGSNFQAGPMLSARLTMLGEPDIIGTDVQFVSANEIIADFDLTGAAEGMWTLSVRNGCGGTPSQAPNIFNVTTCTAPKPSAINPNTGLIGDVITDAQITVDNSEAGPSLSVILKYGMFPPVIGQNVEWINATTIEADFDLSFAVAGVYDVEVVNGCGGPTGVGVGLFEVFECTTPSVTGISPNSANKDTVVDDAQITVDNIFDGGSLAAVLKKTGESDIVGLDVTWINSTTISADFNLAGAATGFWDVEVTNGCGGSPGLGVGLFEVTEGGGGGLVVTSSGNLPAPLPTPNLANLDFGVTGDNTFSNAGVYYHYTTFGVDDERIYRYPLNYSSGGTQYTNLVDPFGNNLDGLLGGGQYMSQIECVPNGDVIFLTEWTGNVWFTPYPGEQVLWWSSIADQPNLTNGYLYFDMPIADIETENKSTPTVWDCKTNAQGSGVDGAQVGIASPYGPNDWVDVTGNYPVDHVGNVDGQVSGLNLKRMAVDANPAGLSTPYNIVYYYLEGAPADNGIEIFKNINGVALPAYIATVDSALVGTAKDICLFNVYGVVGSATTNWVAALEDNGDNTWQVSLFDQNGLFVHRLATPQAGAPVAMDIDQTNRKIHVWANDGGTLKYYILEWQ